MIYKKQKYLVQILFIFILFTCLPAIKSQAATNQETEAVKEQSFRELTSDEIVKEMGAGWNLGNTMDGHTGFTPNETLWQSVETTKELMNSIHVMGFNTVRIPVTWGTMIDDENGYTIDENWISRVQDIVDYCVEQDMYVIINIHHDGAEQSGWLRVATDDTDVLYEKYEAVWKNIAERFKNYDEHLIFESMNEVKGDDDTTAGRVRDMEVINELNQLFVDTVRSTGGNNDKRFLSVPGRYTNIEVTCDEQYGFKMPQDTVENRLFLSVHFYDYTFGMVETLGKTTYSYENATTLANSFELLYENFTEKGIPIILGEYGCVNKNNPVERAYHVEVVTRLCQQVNAVACYWDNGAYDRSTEEPDYNYTLIDRETGSALDPEIIDAIMRGTFLEGAKDLSDIIKDPSILEISSVEFHETTTVMTVGEVKQITYSLTPENTNDILLWKTSDDSIATVYNGEIISRGIGIVDITCYSQSGSFEETLTIEIKPQIEIEKTAISTTQDEYECVAGETFYLNAVSENEKDVLFYQSTDSTILTVSTLGKVTAIAEGRAYIIITGYSGENRVVPITVQKKEVSEQPEIPVALNVYYNDEELSFFSNEKGEPVTITGDGQYTVVFDCSTDLSEKAQTAGVKGLNNLTAIYIKDDDVTNGNTKKTPLSECLIQYDKILVDGEEMDITITEPKSALKSSGILDTNDPFNSWDGSAVANVDVVNHVLNIQGISNPQRVEVTFTLSGMIYQQTEETKEIITAEQIMIQDTGIELVQGDMKVEISCSLIPNDSTEMIAAISKDPGIAMISLSPMIFEDGNAIFYLSAISPGSTEITFLTSLGTEKTIPITIREGVVEQEVVSEDSVSGEDNDYVESKDAETDGISLTIYFVIGIVSVAMILLILVLIKKETEKNFYKRN